jgi:hypothetical protein
MPIWRKDGAELLLRPGWALTSVSIRSRGGRIEIDSLRLLFPLQLGLEGRCVSFSAAPTTWRRTRSDSSSSGSLQGTAPDDAVVV